MLFTLLFVVSIDCIGIQGGNNKIYKNNVKTLLKYHSLSFIIDFNCNQGGNNKIFKNNVNTIQVVHIIFCCFYSNSTMLLLIIECMNKYE